MKSQGETSESTSARPAGKAGPPNWRLWPQILREFPRNHAPTCGWLLLAGVFLCGLTLFPRQEGYQQTDYRVGTIQQRAVIAEFDFNIDKDPEVLEHEQRAAMAAIPPVLVMSDSVEVESLAALRRLRRSLAALDQDQLPAEAYQDRDVQLSQNTLLALLTLDAANIFAQAEQHLATYFSAGIIGAPLEGMLRTSERATLLTGGVDWVGPVNRFYGPARIGQDLEDLRPQGAAGHALAELITTFAWPNVRHDNMATLQRRHLVRDAISRSIGRVLKGEKIIGAHERITPDILRRLESYEAARLRQAAGLLTGGRVRALAGRALLLLILLAGFVLYLLAYRQEMVADLGDLLLLAVSFSGFLIMAAVILNGFHLSGYLIPVAGFAVMLALLFDERLALVATGFLTGIIGLVTSQGLAFIVVIGCGAVAAILSVHQLRDRRQLYRLLLYVPLVHILALGALGMVLAIAFEEILADALYLVANPFIAAGFALFAVPLTESLFGKCTNLTLLELLDLNRPALRRLMLEAPGTYHHSLMVGTLAEAGASAIGANPLMARVQGYYHDIGKIKKPDYFIENQMAGRKNPHDKLAPAMSRLILESHVRDGLALAREFKLPRIVRHGIAQHHGTSLMTYFYHRARKKDPQTPATEYCYPGPRPRTRELAVVLLADQVDAASRSLEEPTPSRLRGLIKQLCEKRALEGELDESHLTLKDLADVREAFLPILTALFHGRISYPKVEQSRGKVSASAAAEPPAKAEG